MVELLFFFFIIIRRVSRSTLFPYTTLFRSCEISVTTTEAWETHNIEKCLAAGYETVVVCSNDRRNLEKIQKLAKEKLDRKSTRLNSSHTVISYAVFCLKKKKQTRSIRKREK